ncbi:MAG: isoprenylcysteine carboxylmethyltransferase family protein [Vicinamibacterales bacterium]|jgi:protein-S-isoprenylcysteine O-methyltransferase Ste14
MNLAERLSSQGRRLFASRSVVPLVLLPVVLLAMPESWRVEAWLGPTWTLVVQWLALSVAFAGVAVRCTAVGFAPDGTSSRDTHRLRAPALNSTGMYSIVRHPLYLGSGLMWVGAAMSLRVWWLVVIVALVYWLYIERVMLVEEAFLRQTFRETFDAWAARTPAFVPRPSQWKSPAGPFLWKRVLSEHNGLLGVAVVIPLLEFLEDQQHGGESLAMWSRDHFDLVILLVAGVVISSISTIVRRRLSEPAPAAATSAA